VPKLPNLTVLQLDLGSSIIYLLLVLLPVLNFMNLQAAMQIHFVIG